MNLLKIVHRTLTKRTKLKLYCSRQFNEMSLKDVPGVTAASIKKTLSIHGFNVEVGHTCFAVNCLMCKASKSDTKAKMYINKTTGMYMCSCCKQTGEWDQLSGYLSLSKTKRAEVSEMFKDQTSSITHALDEVRQSTRKLSLLTEQELHSLLQKFKLPAVNLSSLEGLDIRTDDKHNRLYFPLENVDNTVVGYRTVNRDTKQQNLVPNIQCGGLLTWRPPRTRVTAVLVPTIADFLVLLNSNLPFNLVCLPDGTNTLSQYVLPSLERFKKLVLWLGSDLKAWDSFKHFANKLGEKRCAVVRANEPLPHLKPEQDFKTVINGARVVWHPSITSFSALREEVWLKLLNDDKVQGVKWKRFPTLNKILLGHRRGELTVLTGPTGSGKTTFISEYSLDLAMQGVNTLWGSFEIKNVRLMKTMLQQMAGTCLKQDLDKFEKAADAFEKVPIYFMTFHGQQSLKVVMDAVEHASYVHDIGHVIIDNLQFMMGTTTENRHMDRFWKQDAIIAAFRTFATDRNCHVTLVIHPRKERNDEDLSVGSIFGGAKASQEADNVLLIQDKRLTSVRGKKYLQVAKNRYSGDLGMMPLDFNKNSLSYAQKKPKETNQDKNETTVIDSNNQVDKTD